MAFFTSTADLNMTFEGHQFVGPAGTVFRLDDSYQPEFDELFGRGSIPGLVWVVVDEIALLGGD
jgi:hypothetical protein